MTARNNNDTVNDYVTLSKQRRLIKNLFLLSEEVHFGKSCLHEFRGDGELLDDGALLLLLGDTLEYMVAVLKGLVPILLVSP